MWRLYQMLLLIGVTIWGIFCGTQAVAQGVTIYSDDFEGAVSGWSVNNTDFDPDVTTFLGRFDNNPKETQRTFTIPSNMDRVEISFDFYRFDSWDNTARWGFDRFEVDIDGTEIFSLPFSATQAARSGTTGNIDWSHAPLGPTEELAFGTGQYWFDQLHRVNITVNSPGTSLTLTLRADVNQGGNDESAGFDNILIEAFPIPPDLSIIKEVEVLDALGIGDYAIPGNEVMYSFKMTSDGGAIDAGTIVLVDKLPPDLEVFTGDLDGNGNPFTFTDNSTPPSGLSCCASGTYEFSDSTTTPITYGYAPMTPYDSNITYIRITPSGTLRDATAATAEVEIEFKAKIQ